MSNLTITRLKFQDKQYATILETKVFNKHNPKKLTNPILCLHEDVEGKDVSFNITDAFFQITKYNGNDTVFSGLVLQGYMNGDRNVCSYTYSGYSGVVRKEGNYCKSLKLTEGRRIAMDEFIKNVDCLYYKHDEETTKDVKITASELFDRKYKNSTL